MAMETVQIRLTPRLLKQLDALVGEGLYPSRSDAVRDAVRQFLLEQDFWRKQVGTIGPKGDAVQIVRAIRKGLSNGRTDPDELNAL